MNYFADTSSLFYSLLHTISPSILYIKANDFGFTVRLMFRPVNIVHFKVILKQVNMYLNVFILSHIRIA
jgi:hypothetical protein